MPLIPYTKPALTYAAQLQQLKVRGLVVANDPQALHLLETISYYRFSAYWYPLLADPKSAHVFKAGSRFEDAFRLYCFDRHLRKLVVAELEKVEVAIRSKLIYTLSHKYGAFWYNQPAVFANPGLYAGTLAKLNDEYNRSDEKFIQEFRLKYSDPLPPSWMMLELTSFGTLSQMYRNLRYGRDKRNIANFFCLDDTTFGSWLHTFVYIRNVCAHHGRLWNRVFRIAPRMPLTTSHPWITITTLPNPTPGLPAVALNDKTYFLLSMIAYLLSTVDPANTFKNKLNQLLANYPSADVAAMGFPVGWAHEPLWI
jgi:abortive infection bacteriophage resistance protein